MEALKTEILNEKAMTLIRGMEELNLIRVTESPLSKAQAYLHKMRSQAETSPNLEEITAVVEEVRSKRYAKR